MRAHGILILGLLFSAILTAGCSGERGINSFDECVAAGNPVMESYPRQCRAGDGQMFTEVVDSALSDNTEDAETPIGGERDEHGCLGPAGYSWNEEVSACLREWELDEDARRAAGIAVAPLSYRVTIISVENYGCHGCFRVNLERNDNRMQLTVMLKNWTFYEGQLEEGSLTLEEALSIAKGSECVEEGELSKNAFYNEITGTWWIELKPYYLKEGCSPACVVSDETLKAEINWRCTGAIQLT